MLFGVNRAGAPSVAKSIVIGLLPPSARTASSVQSDDGVQATSDGGTAQPIRTSFPNTPAEPDIDMPPGTQLD